MEKTEQPYSTNLIEPKFDKKFKVIVKTKITENYFGKLEWVNKNSNGIVEVRMADSIIDGDSVFFAFSDPDDALIFKIRYSL